MKVPRCSQLPIVVAGVALLLFEPTVIGADAKATEAPTNDRVRQLEARAAFETAEERFAAVDYKGALEFIEQATKGLGGSNGKILLLKIQIQSELAKSDPRYVTNVLNSI